MITCVVCCTFGLPMPPRQRSATETALHHHQPLVAIHEMKAAHACFVATQRLRVNVPRTECGMPGHTRTRSRHGPYLGVHTAYRSHGYVLGLFGHGSLASDDLAAADDVGLDA